MNSQGPKDPVFEDYLQGQSDLSRLYQDGMAAMPPLALDETILAASRRAVRSRPRVMHTRFARSWVVPVSLAAVLVLSIGLVTFMSKEIPIYDDAAKLPPFSPSVREETTIDAPRKDRLKEKAETRGRKAAPLPSRTLQYRLAAPPAAAPAPMEDEVRAVHEADRMKGEAMGPPLQDSMQKGSAIGGRRTQNGPAPEVKAAADAAERTPEQWLARIEELRREGRHAEADASLMEFRKRYPEYLIEKGRK